MSKKKWVLTKKKLKKLQKKDDGAPLVSYGESIGPPCSWPMDMTRHGGDSVGGSLQQCDDDTHLERSFTETEGLYSNVEGEAIGDFG